MTPSGSLHRISSRCGAHGRLFSTAHSGAVLRFEEMTGTWVVFSSGRSDRPKQTIDTSLKTRLSELPDYVKDCPFCSGNEHLMPNVLLSINNNSMRVVPNKFPAVAPLDNQFQHHESQQFLDQNVVNNEVPAVGFHEVVIERPEHNDHIATSPDTSMARDLLMAFRERGRTHREFDAIEHSVFFKNHGSTAGASLVHPHSQIVSTPVVPVEAQRLQSLALEYFRRNRVSLYQQIVEEELRIFQNMNQKSRVVDVTENFLAVVPYASPGPYVITILPRFDCTGTEVENGVDCSDFVSMTDDLLEECADILYSCLRRLHRRLDEPCFNLVVQTAPVPNRGVQASLHSSAFFRWHIRITPRLGAGAMAGFELGSGFFSNSHLPECDAAELRGAVEQH